MAQFRGLLGVALILAIGLALCPNRRRINLRVVVAGLALQLFLAWACLSFDRFVGIFDFIAAGFNRVVSFADAGSEFIFQKLADVKQPWGFIFAVKVLPVIIFFGSLMGVLYHLGIMQRLVAAIAWLLRKTLGITGVEALSASANIFLGQTEAPLCIRPYLASMTRAQLMAVMTGGFATIAGSVMAAYVGILGGDSDPERILFAKHLLTASLMSAPAGLVMARIMYPETEPPPPEQLQTFKPDRTTRNVLDAAATGATDGLHLALNVAAMLIAFVALLAMLNWPLEWFSNLEAIKGWRDTYGVPVLSIQSILGMIFAPIAWSMGVPWGDCRFFGGLMGTSIVATEFVAYTHLGRAIAEQTVSHRAAQIAAYTLCGFANLPSIAIQIGGIGALAPGRRADLAALGLRAMTAGALACWMTGAIASLFIA